MITSQNRLTRSVGYCLVLLLVLGACSRQSSRDTRPPNQTPSPPASPLATSSPAAAGDQPPPRFEATACNESSGGEEGVLVHLTGVRVSPHDGFDRVTFEFQDPQEPGGRAGIPRFQIRTVKPPLAQDGSGDPLEVQGKSFLSVVFHGATGVKMVGESPQPTYRGPKELRPGLRTLTEVQQAGDFEATLSWFLGLSRATCWRTIELRDPLRVAIDLRH